MIISRIARLIKKEPKIMFVDGYYQRNVDGMIIKSRHQNTLRNTCSNIFNKGIYDFNTTKESPLIIDGGANIGLGTLYWKSKFPNARIVAFEPSKEVCEMLRVNLKTNNINDVEVIEKALYDSIETLEFTSNEALSGSLILEKKLPETYTVQTTLLSSYIVEEIDLLKLDIEGVELKVIREIQDKLHMIKRIFVEYHSFEKYPQTLSELLGILQKAGFRYYLDAEYKLDDPFNGFPSSLGQDLQVNIWAIRK